MTGELERALSDLLKTVVRELVEELRPRVAELGTPAARNAATDRDDPLLLRPTEAAKRLGISTRHLHKLSREGTLPSVRVGKAVRYSLESLCDWIEASQVRDDDRGASVARSPGQSRSTPRETRRRVAKVATKSPPVEGPTEPRQAIDHGPRAVVRRARQVSQASSEQKRATPFESLLADIGLERRNFGPLTNGDLLKIAEVDIPTLHGWMYHGRTLPSEAVERLRRHFLRVASETTWPLWPAS